MDARNPEALLERAEMYYCLSRAFLAPLDEHAHAAMADALADDLEAIGCDCGYAIATATAGYRTAIAAIPGPPELLQLYSCLFLVPPRKVSINTASYIDGAMNGGTVVAIEAAYRSCRVEREENFRDLADHLSVQLEFVAFLYLKQAEATGAGAAYALPLTAGNFLDAFVRGWLPSFVAELEASSGECANPYLHLARILVAAVRADARALPTSAKEMRVQRAIGKARRERAMRGVTDEDMQIIAQKLREKGLATEHLAIPPEMRDEAQGLSRKLPPSPRRGSRLG
jgi:TorA maturation chaperone TorD